MIRTAPNKFAIACLVVGAIVVAGAFLKPAAAKAPTNHHLREALKGTSRIVVRGGGTCHRSEEREPVLAEVTAPKEIEELIAALQIDEADSGFQCMCCGDPTFEFYKGERLKVEMGYHHGKSVRWRAWESDVMLTAESQEAVLRWLEVKGVTGPRKEWERETKGRE